jgi:hypothetical protein
MDILDVIFYIYLLPMCIVLLPILFTPDELDDAEDITRTEIFILSAIPLLNLYSAISLIDIVVTSIIIYVRKRQY